MRSAVYQSGCHPGATPGRLPPAKPCTRHPSHCINSRSLCIARSHIKDVDGRNPLATPAELPLLGKRIIVTGEGCVHQPPCTSAQTALLLPASSLHGTTCIDAWTGPRPCPTATSTPISTATPLGRHCGYTCGAHRCHTLIHEHLPIASFDTGFLAADPCRTPDAVNLYGTLPQRRGSTARSCRPS